MDCLKVKTLIEYPCVFDEDKACPVKKQYKLEPESLVEFCKICNRYIAVRTDLQSADYLLRQLELMKKIKAI